MLRRPLALGIVFALGVLPALAPSRAFAQGGPIDAAAASPSAPPMLTAPATSGSGSGSGSGSSPSQSPSPAPSPASSADEPRPARGPAVRERGGRRTRAGSTASGVLMLVVLVGMMGWYVVKRLRR